MKSKTSFFNCGLFKSNLKRFWPIFAAYFAVLLLLIPMGGLNSWSEVEGGRIIYTVDDYLSAIAMFVNPITAIVMAMGVFGFMFNQRSCGMIASLPVKRGTVFATALVSGIVPILVINVVIALVTATPLIAEYNALAAKSLLIWLAVNSMHYVFFFGFAAVTATVTGSIAALPVFYVIFNFLAVGIESGVKEIFRQFIFGYTNNGNRLATRFFSPIVNIASSDGFEYVTVYETKMGMDTARITSVSYADWRTAAIYCAVGVLLMAMALIFYRRRKMENCGDVIAIPALRPVFKYGVAMCLALCNAILLSSIFGNGSGTIDAAGYIVYMLIGAFIGWFGSEMLLKKSFKVFDGNWTGFVMVAVLCILFMLGSCFDVLGLGSRTPDTEDIDRVEINCMDYGAPMPLSDAENVERIIALNRSIVENKDSHLNADFGNEYYIELCYVLKNGRSIYREYPMDIASDDFASYMELFSCEEVIERFTEPGVPTTPEYVQWCNFSYYDSEKDEYFNVELTAEQAIDFFVNAWCADVKDGCLSKRPVYSDNTATLELEFKSGGQSLGVWPYNNYYYNCCIGEYFPRSMQWVKDNLGIDLAAMFTK